MAWEEVAVAATSSIVKALSGAALALPILSLPVNAGQIEAPRFGMKYLNYAENDRMRVSAPWLWVEAPLGDASELAFTGTVNSVSGASPQYVTNRGGIPVHTLSSASIRDVRRAADVRFTHYFNEISINAGAAVSSENDYLSRNASLVANFEFNQKNTTLSLGGDVSGDEISATNNPGMLEKRTTRSVLAGVTQLLSPVSLVQSNFTYAWGNGYYDDPYKYTLSFLTDHPPVVHDDTRPDGRHQFAWLTRYRHYLPSYAAALLADYRYYRDNWGVRAHTVELGLSKEFGSGWRIIPSLRYYSQNQAEFYATSFSSSSGIGSSDPRLAAFGALTASLKLVKTIDARTSFDIAAAAYRQDADYRLGGSGSADFLPLTARFLMLGFTRSF